MRRSHYLLTGALVALSITGSAYAQTDNGFSMVILSDTQLFRRPTGEIGDPPSANADNANDTNEAVRDAVNNITQLNPWTFTEIGENRPVKKPSGVIINGDLTENGDRDEAAHFTRIWLGNRFNSACALDDDGPNDEIEDDTDCALYLPNERWVLEGSSEIFYRTDGSFGYKYNTGIPLYLGLGNHDYLNNVNDQTFGFLGNDSDGAAKESVFRVGRMIAALYGDYCHDTKTGKQAPWDQPDSRCYLTGDDIDNFKWTGIRPYFQNTDDWHFDPDGSLGDGEPTTSLAYSWDEGNYHFVQLNNFPTWEVRLEDDGLDGEAGVNIVSALPWLHRDLDQATADGKYIVINVHDWGQGYDSSYFLSISDRYNYKGCVERTKDAQGEKKAKEICGGFWKTHITKAKADENFVALEEVLEGHNVVAVFAGHSHQKRGQTDLNKLDGINSPFEFIRIATHDIEDKTLFSGPGNHDGDDKCEETNDHDENERDNGACVEDRNKRDDGGTPPVYRSGAVLCGTGLYVDFQPRYFNVRTFDVNSSGNPSDLPSGTTGGHHKGCKGFAWKKDLRNTHIINQAPTIKTLILSTSGAVIPPGDAINEGTTIEIDATAKDPDGDTLGFNSTCDVHQSPPSLTRRIAIYPIYPRKTLLHTHLSMMAFSTSR